MKQSPDFDKNDPSGGDGFDYEKFAAEEASLETEAAKGEENSPDNTQETGVATKTKNRDDERSNLYDWIQCLVAALLICVLVFAFFIRIIGIIGDSMNPTFEDGDSVVISDLFYEPQQGDVIVLRKLSFKDEPIIKRVIATEGQTVKIDFDNGIVYVDDVALDEPYILEPTTRALDFDGSVTVPENCVFVMGDNRNDSLDSRFSLIGCIDEREILGKVLFRILPFDKFGSVY